MINFFFFFQAEDGIRDKLVTGVQTCALPISAWMPGGRHGQEAGRCAAQARGIRCGDLAGARPARARVDEDVPGARRRGLSRPVAQTWAADRFEGGVAPERAFHAARVLTRAPGTAPLAQFYSHASMGDSDPAQMPVREARDRSPKSPR